MAMEAASSSSIWMKVPPTVGMRAANLSTTSVEGVIGYPAANRAPAARAPSQQAWSPSRKCAPVRTPFGSACMAGSVNCEVRAIQATQVATAAFLSGYHVRWVISLGIERRGERQHVSGAKLDAEAAALAALDGDVDGTFGHSGVRSARRWPHGIRFRRYAMQRTGGATLRGRRRKTQLFGKRAHVPAEPRAARQFRYG